MTLDEAISYIDGRTQEVCDALGNRGNVKWSVKDATAVKVVLSELKSRNQAQEGE
jgi:hypothetical protein